MQINSETKIEEIISKLKKQSQKCHTLENYIELAFNFRYGHFSIEPLQKKAEIETLLKILEKYPSKNFLEIGTASGGTFFLLTKIADPKATIISIDLPEGAFGGELYPNSNMSIYESFANAKQKIHLIRSNSHQKSTLEKTKRILKSKKLDFLLIDGDHTFKGVKKDYEMYHGLVRKDGIIAFHDINKGPKKNVGEVSKFWKEIKSKYPSFEIIDFHSGEGFGFGFILNTRVKNSIKVLAISKILLNEKSNRIIQLHNKIKNIKTDILSKPLSALLNVYSDRPDLQQTFPEASKGNLTELIKWAVVMCNKKDVLHSKAETINRKKLSKFSRWYTQYLEDIQKNESNIKSYNDELEKNFRTQINSLESEKKQYNDQISSLESEKKQYNDQISSLESEKKQYNDQIGSLESEKKQFKNEISNKQNEILKLDQEISKQSAENSALIRDYTYFKDELARHQHALDNIKSGTGFKIIRFYATKIEKIRKIKTNFDVIAEFIKKYGFGEFLQQAKIKIKKREFTISTDPVFTPSSYIEASKIPQEKSSSSKSDTIFSLIPPKNLSLILRTKNSLRRQQKTNYSELEEKQIYKINYKVSVVIPTYSDKTTIDYLLSKINSQKGIKDLEIIFVNSGLHDLSYLQDLHNVKLINIKPEEFNHGTTRNLGASKATRDYILFLSDDAIPSNENLFYNLCTELSYHPECGCVSPRQVPKSDSDLMFKSGITNHYKFLEYFFIHVKPNSFDRLTIEQKRSVAQIDDVCACYRRNVFSKYQYTDLGYGEDLEMGIKLVNDGYYISNFGRNYVIHSHNRDAFYWLKRAFTEHSICNPLLGAKIWDFKKQYKISTEEELLEVIWSIYNSIGLTIDLLKKENFEDIRITFANIHNKSRKFFLSTEKPKSLEPSIEKLFEIIFKDIPKLHSKKNLLLENYLARLYTIENFMTETYPSLMNIQNDLFDALYKIFGTFMGDVLSGFNMYSKKNDLEIKLLPKIEKILKSGV